MKRADPLMRSPLFAGLLFMWTGGPVSAYEPPRRIEPYPAPPGARESRSYSVSVDGRDVQVVRYKDVSYAHFLHSDRVTVRNIKMINDLTNPNTDGVNPDSSRHVTIEDCFMYCSDDCNAGTHYTYRQVGDVGKDKPLRGGG